MNDFVDAPRRAPERYDRFLDGARKRGLVVV